MVDQLEQIPISARTALLTYINDPARSVAELDRVFGSILGERLSRALIGAAPFESLIDLLDRVSGIGEQKLMAMVSAQLEGRIPDSTPTNRASKPTPPRGQAPGFAGSHAASSAHPTFASLGTYACAGTIGTACSGTACFAPVGAPCFPTSAAAWPPTPPEPSSQHAAPVGAQDDHGAETGSRTPAFEDAYRARLAQIQNYWKAIDVEALDLTMMRPAATVAGCLGTAGTVGTIGTTGGCAGTFGTALCFGSSGIPMEPHLSAGGTAYTTPQASAYAQSFAGSSVLAGTAGTFGTAGTAGCIGGTIGSMATVGTRGCWG